MKLGVIAELLRRPDLEECFKLAAQLGVAGVQLYAGHNDRNANFLALDGAALDAIAASCAAKGLAITAVCGDICDKSFQVPHEAPVRVAVCKRVIDHTARLGCRVMTTHIGCVPDNLNDPVYPVMVNSVREAADYAASHGVTFAIETGPELADTLKRFIDDVASPGLGVNLDPANLRGVSAEDPAYAVKVLGAHIVHTHAKDAIHTHSGSAAAFYGMRNLDGSRRTYTARAAGYSEVPLGQGQVDWDAYLAALREVGYDGFLTVERECGDDPVADIKTALDFLRGKTT